MSFLSTLSLSVRKAYPIIRSAVKQGLASRSIQALLTKAGLGIRRQTLLDVMRLEKHGFASAKTFRLLPDDVLPRLGDIPFAITRLRHEYSYVFEVKTLFENKLTTRIMTVSTNERLTIGQAKESLTDTLESNPEVYGEVDQVISITGEGIQRVGRKGFLLP